MVDDDDFNLGLLAYLLEMDGGYRVETACYGVETLNKPTTMGFDLVLMDMRMPLLDGAATIQKIRSGTIPGCPTPTPPLPADEIERLPMTLVTKQISADCNLIPRGL
ncbi:MAG: response regulator [Rhodospirillaceae bacterium]